MARLRALALFACIGAALGAGSVKAAEDPYASLLAPSAVCGSAADALSLDQASAERTMLCLTNYARTRSGLQPLRANPLLAQAGRAKLTADLGCGEFSHTPCGRPFRSVFAAYLRGASSYQIGENIAWGSGDYGTPRQTMNSWLHSAAHRKNILTPDFRELGIGYQPHETFQGYSDATLWSQEFGTRK
ncbi:MAG: CAP domain-containing protein [Solirubrobacteraceae bacterium]